MKNLKVRDVMTKKVVAVNIGTSVVEVAHILTRNRFHGVPVVNEKNQLVGIITESDFFIKSIPNLYLPSYIELISSTKFAKRLSTGEQKRINMLVNATAGDIMTGKCYSVSSLISVSDLFRIFKKKGYYTVPVTDKNGKLAGIVTLADIIKML